MALVRKNISNKKQAVLIAAIVVLFAATFGLAYFFLLRKPDIDLTPKSELLFGKKTNDLTAPASARTGLDALEELNKSAAANQLKKFGNWPLPVEPKGRADLFGLPVDEKIKK